MATNIKLGDPVQTSYVNATQANTYFTNRRNAAKWSALAVASKNEVLIQAANDLEAFNYIGEKYYDNQGLQFPRDDHEVVTGNCATPFTINSFTHADLYSTTYAKIPGNRWKYGSCHITAGTPVRDIKLIASSDVSDGTVTMVEDFTASPNANAKFIVFAPIDKEVQDAQCEQALYILENPNIDSLQSYKELGVRSIRIGDVDMEFKQRGKTRVSISPKARKLLARWIKRAHKLLRA